MSREFNLYRHISLEFMNSFPGQVYLRFEPFSKAPAIMIQVMPGDMVDISRLAGPYETTVKDELEEQDDHGHIHDDDGTVEGCPGCMYEIEHKLRQDIPADVTERQMGMYTAMVHRNPDGSDPLVQESGPS